MKALKANLIFFTVIFIISSIFQSCGNQQRADIKTENNDTTFGKPVSINSDILNPDSLRFQYFEIRNAFDCLNECNNCLTIPCNKKCDWVCKKYQDRILVTVHDMDKKVNPDEAIILLVTTDAVNLKLKSNQYRILSEKPTKKFNLMDAELDNLISNLDILYKKTFSINSSNKGDVKLKVIN